MKELKIGIIVADDEEFKPLENIIIKHEYSKSYFLNRPILTFHIDKCKIIAIHCGVGKVNATAGAVYLINEGCNYILNYGLSGGIHGVNRGEICICTKYLEHDFDLTALGYKPCEKPSQKYIYETDKSLLEMSEKMIPDCKSGTAVTGDCFVSDNNKREYLKTQFDAISCDMETAAIAYVCSNSNTPFISIRKISDDAGSDANSSYKDMNNKTHNELSMYIINIIEKIVSST